MEEGQEHRFIVYPVMMDELGPELSYVEEYIACRAEDTNASGFPLAAAVLGKGDSAYEAIADLCRSLS